ncbi:hypothetical protein [Phenylobacterium sp.]|uniref:hypothetical protein n=1 Tax=Phenylobacterium sp. TaxID=1871053 RepID=UPI0025D1FA68|nr:hypothetical protein [Phenylobacterium sp.]
MTTLDYAALYEANYRPSRRLKRLVARILWVGLLIVRPNLAMEVLAERRSAKGW